MNESSDSTNPHQKGGDLEGGALSDDALASSESIFDTNRYGMGQKGLQQWYTPDKAASLVARVVGSTVATIDLTAGDGSLLKHFDRPRRFGVEIDKDQIKNAADADTGYTSICGDIQHVYTLLRNAGPTWDGIVLNPPFGLKWSDPTVMDGKEINSTLLTTIYGTRLLSHNGQIVLIAGRGRFDREILECEEVASHFYAVVDVDDLFPGTQEPCVIAFGINPEIRRVTSEGVARRQVTPDMLDLVAQWVTDERANVVAPYERVAGGSWYSHNYGDTFADLQKEYDRRTGIRLKADRAFDVMVGEKGKIQFLPSGYAVAAMRKVDAYDTLRYLHGQSINYFAQNEHQWFRLDALAQQGIISIEPKFRQHAEELVGAILRDLAPLYDIKPQQGLGFLADVSTIECIKSDPEKKFNAGEFYAIRVATAEVAHDEQRVVESKKNPGEYTTKTFKISKKVMRITLQGNGAYHQIDDGGDHASENIRWIIDHFKVPVPQSVASRHPKEIKKIEDACQVILDRFAENSAKYEAKHPAITPYSHRPFQKRDISRLVFKRSGLLSWEQGLGKTLGGLLFQAACQEIHGAQEATLIVTAKDLVPQWSRECERFLGVKPTLIKSHAQAKKIAHDLRLGGKGIFITYYEAMSITGTKGKNLLLPPVTVKEWQEDRLVKGTDRYGYFYYDDDDASDSTYKVDKDGELVQTEDGRNVLRKQVIVPDGGSTPEGRKKRYGYIRPQYEKITKRKTSKELCPQCEADTRSGWNGIYCESTDAAGQKCGYSHYAVRLKPIASYLSTAFKRGTVILDEITLIQGNYAKRSIALRGLRARHKLGMTGTPIKNFISQAFWVLWWCLGSGSRRFGFDYGGYMSFESEFSVVEWQMDNGRKTSRKALPEVTNLSKLWRMLCSSIIRRRKEETGEDLVPLFWHEIQTPLGMAQAEQMDTWLKQFHEFFKEKYPDAPVVKAGMHKIMAPMLGLNWKLDYTCTVPESDPDFEWTAVEGVSNWTPANLRVCELALALAKQDRKVLIGSNLVKTSEWIASRLEEKGVKAVHILDGDGTTVNPDERAKRVFSFQTDQVQVFCAGVNAIRLGHNLDAADAVILSGLDWSFDTMSQFVARVHRLTSKNPIDVFVILPTLDGQETITTRKWGMLKMKENAADLALDGRLVPRREQAITEAEVIRELMERGITVTDEAVDEVSIFEAWEAMPMIEDFDTEGVIPTRPVIETEEEVAEKAACEAAEVMGEFLRALWENPEPMPTPEVEDVVPDDLVLEQNAVEMEAPGDPDDFEAEAFLDEYEAEVLEEGPLVTNDTSETDLVPAEDEVSESDSAAVVTEESEAEASGADALQPTGDAPSGAEPTAALATSAPAFDPMGQLKQAKELHDLGVLTDEEFTTLKTDLLGAVRKAAAA